MPPSIDYAVPGPMTTLAAVDPAALDGAGTDPVEICRPVAGLVIQPEDRRLWTWPRRDSRPTRSARRTSWSGTCWRWTRHH
jgi:hypothetical protein